MTDRSVQQTGPFEGSIGCPTGTSHAPDPPQPPPTISYDATNKSLQSPPKLSGPVWPPPVQYYRQYYHPQHPTTSELPLQYPIVDIRQPEIPYTPPPGTCQKRTRAKKVCNQCRVQKAKCDERRPACSNCEMKDLICVYGKTPPSKEERATHLLLDRIQRLEDFVDEKLSLLQRVQHENGLQLAQLTKNVAIRKQNLLIPEEQPGHALHDLLKEDRPKAFQNTKPFEDENWSAVIEKRATEVLDQALASGEGGELSIPVEHATAAHKLLRWPSVKKALEPEEYAEDYVMKLEARRNFVGVYGRSEGDEVSEDPAVLIPLTKLSAAVEGIYTHHPSQSGPRGGINQHQSKLADIGLDDDGRLTTSRSTICHYYKSYMEHLHKLHPFLDQNTLEQEIEQFITEYCPGATDEMPRGAGVKRKRSCDALHDARCYVGSPATVKAKAGPNIIQKSIGNATILLVLALGCICEVRDRPLPGPIMDTLVDFRKTQIPRPPTREPSSFYSPCMGDGRESTTERPDPDDQYLRNLGGIPGLAFYVYSTSILMIFQGANDLHYVQAALLAGLYAGQLAHPCESHRWIGQAARACQVLIRSKRYENMRDDSEKDKYNFAYWTCLQLESDILAELDLRPSGISRYEACIALPKGRFIPSLPNDISAPSIMMMFFYSAQVHLRKVLNRIHTDLYKVRKEGETPWTPKVIQILSVNLEQWRSNLPDFMKWDDNEAPSKDINVARMRAKYYGARYIIHRPLLYYALHLAGQSKPGISPAHTRNVPPAVIKESGSKSQRSSPPITCSQSVISMACLPSETGLARKPSPPKATGNQGQCTYRELLMELRHACEVCIESAIRSTEAFDGIEGRPIVTNIFGTAHAQFGNMLVLSATYKSHLSELVDRNDLEQLLRRTIKFLLQSRYTSRTLRVDARILTGIYMGIFGEPIRDLTSLND